MKRGRAILGVVMAVGAAVLVGTEIAAAHTAGGTTRAATAAAGCNFGKGGQIKHLIYIQFDNVHFLRDNPNVPSDLEQMPNLLNFIRKNGTLDKNDHTILISHTGGGILSTLTGLYPDRHGQAVSNSYNFFRPDGSTGFSSTFKYWTDLTDGGNPVPPATPSGDPSYNMVNADPVSLGGTGAVRNTPAPWVPFARAGCDVGNVGVANTVLENNTASIFRGGPTTLAAIAPTGATNIKVASTGGFIVGPPPQVITIDTGANAETATIAAVGTGGALGTGITLTTPLAKQHSSGVTVYGPNATDPTGDMTKVFGADSAEWTEGRTSQIAPAGTAARALAQTDFVGIAIHCAQGTGSVCSGNPDARTDFLPDEKDGYTGFKGLFGAKYVNPAITGGAHAVDDTTATPGHPSPIADPFGQPGFPGFDGMYAKNTLGYVAQMQEHGVPVTFAYISDAHDNHGNSGNIHIAYGPGERGYHDQLVAYDQAFGAFFNRLQDDGITKDNTLFVVTVEEGDHFAGTAPDGPCDGVTVFCTYNNGHVSEVNGDLRSLVTTYNAIHGTTATTNFSVHSDMAPNVYVTGNPTPGSASARALEKVLSDMQVTNPLSGQKQALFVAMADPVEMKALHMVTADPARTPTFTPFAQGDYFLSAPAGTPTTCRNASGVADLDGGFPCAYIPGPSTPGFNPNQTFAWNHGGIQPEVATTWLGLVGPGVKKLGLEDEVWTDHTDIRPTILHLLGLEDTYVPDGRVLTEFLNGEAPAQSLKQHRGTVERLGQVYKQLNASFGQFAADTLAASTAALASNTPGDTTYTQTETEIASLTSERDALADEIRAALDAAEFNDQAIDENQAKDWIEQGNDVLDRASDLAK